MSLRGFINRVGDNLSQSEKETTSGNQEEIDRLKGMDCYRNNRYVRIILNMGASALEKVTFGTRYLSNVDSVYQNLGISDRTETIIATVRNKEGVTGIFSKENLAITDKALYAVCSSLRQGKQRFPLESLSKYIVTISEDYTVVDLMNEDGRLGIMVRFFAGSNKGEAEKSIVKIIKAIQKDIVENTDYGKADRKRLCDWLIDTINKESYEDKLSYGIARSLRSMLSTDGEYRDQLMGCLLQYFIATADIELLQGCMQDLFEVLPDSEKGHLRQLFYEAIRNYETMLQDPDKDFDDSYIKKSLKNIKVLSVPDDQKTGIAEVDRFVNEILEYFNSHVPFIRKYLKIRGDMSCDFLTLYSDNNTKEFITSEDAQNYFKFACTYKDRRMAALFDQVKNGQEISKDQIKWIDGFGFDALHYSIFLHKTDIANKIIDTRKETNTASEDTPEELRSLYDYGVIATILNEEDLADKLMDFSEDIKPMIDSLKSLNALLKIRNATLTLAKKNLSNCEELYRKARGSAEYDQNKVADYYERINSYKEKINDLNQEVNDLRYDIREAESDLESCKKCLKQKYQEEADRIRNSTDSIEWFFCYIYQNPEEYYSFLKNGYEGKILYFYGVAYYVPLQFVDRIKTKPSYDEQNYQGYSSSGSHANRQGNTHGGSQQTSGGRNSNGSSAQQFNKPYGNHWFSNDAYNDIDVLRKEYHKLAAKYHPDNNPDGVAAFLDIQEERSKILDLLGEK